MENANCHPINLQIYPVTIIQFELRIYSLYDENIINR